MWCSSKRLLSRMTNVLIWKKRGSLEACMKVTAPDRVSIPFSFFVYKRSVLFIRRYMWFSLITSPPQSIHNTHRQMHILNTHTHSGQPTCQMSLKHRWLRQRQMQRQSKKKKIHTQNRENKNDSTTSAWGSSKQMPGYIYIYILYYYIYTYILYVIGRTSFDSEIN